jgi:hypothetical protein
VAALELLFGVTQDVNRETGVAGPPAAALIIVLPVTVTLALLVGTYRVILGSDFVEGAAGSP